MKVNLGGDTIGPITESHHPLSLPFREVPYSGQDACLAFFSRMEAGPGLVS